MILRVLERMVATVWAQGTMYKAVVKSVLLYESKSLVVTGEMLKVLTSFHHQSAHRITGMMEKCGTGSEWEYPAVVEAMKSVGIHPIRVYIKRRQMTITERVEL